LAQATFDSRLFETCTNSPPPASCSNGPPSQVGHALCYHWHGCGGVDTGTNASTDADAVSGARANIEPVRAAGGWAGIGAGTDASTDAGAVSGARANIKPVRNAGGWAGIGAGSNAGTDADASSRAHAGIDPVRIAGGRAGPGLVAFPAEGGQEQSAWYDQHRPEL